MKTICKGVNIMLKDRRKNKDLRDMIDSVEKALWEDTQSKCQCGKMGYFPKGK